MYYIGAIAVDSSAIYHHGIKGQKWGIRRFQNKDGSLTSAGLSRYRDMYDAGQAATARVQDAIEKAKRSAGVIRFTDSTDILKKGSKINRLTNVQETVDERRKYGSLLKSDQEIYINEAEALPYEGDSRDLYSETYEAKRDLKIANANAVSDYLINKYAEKTIGEIGKDSNFMLHGSDISKDVLKQIGKTKIKDLKEILGDSEKMKTVALYTSGAAYGKGSSLTKKEKADIADMNRLANVGQEIMRTMMAAEMYGGTKGKDLMSHFTKKGYDAIMDIEDIVGHNVDYPVIFLNPGQSMKKIKSEKIY